MSLNVFYLFDHHQSEEICIRSSMSNIHELIRVVNGIFQLVRLVRVVKQWFTSRADSELHIISETARSDLTTRTTRTTRTSGETIVYVSYRW